MTTEYYGLVRAAELTVQSGRRYFAVLNGSPQIKASTYTTPGGSFTTSTTTGQVNAVGTADASAYGNQVYGTSNTTGTYNGTTYSDTVSTPAETHVVHKPVTYLTVQTLPHESSKAMSSLEVVP